MATVSTVIVKNTCTLANGEDYSETARVDAAHWRSVGGKKSIEDGEKGLALWLRKRNPKFGPDLQVTFIREEETRTDQYNVRPQV